MAINAGPDIVEDDLLICLDAANVRSYPGTGDDWNDVSTASLVGEFENGPTFSTTNGGCIVLDGTDDRIKFAADTVQPDFPFTLNAWVMFNEADQLDPIWRSAFANTYYGGFWVTKLTDNTIQMNTGTWDSANDTKRRFKTGTTTIAVDTWYNICAVFTNLTTSTLYLNGVDDGGTDGGTGNELDYNSGKVNYIGRFPRTSYANIKIAQLAVYSKALAASEVKQNYIATRQRYGV